MLIMFGTVALILGVFIMAALLVINSVKHNRLYKKLSALGIIAMLIVIINTIAIMVIGNMTYDENVQTKRYDSISPIEHCVIGEEEIYTFFFQDGDKPIKIGNTNYPSIKICNINAENSTIYELDIDKAYVIEHTVYTQNKLERIWQYILFFAKIAPSEKKVYDIYVPTGTAQDLQQNVQNLT